MESQLQSFQAAIVREKANVGRSEKLIDKAEVKLRSTELRAPRDGLVVYARAGGESSLAKVQPGMIPFEGQPLIYLPDLSTMVVDTVVNEVDIGKVKEGGPVEVRLEGFPGAVFHGSVMKIGSLAKLKQSPTGDVTGIKAFDVTVLIEEKDPRLKPGLTATIDIIVDHRVDVVSIPLSAVDFRNGEGTVFVADGQMIAERKVDLGPSNEQHVVVEDGLRPGEQVLLTPSLPVRQ
jgi:HlyD family secretion protein